MQCWRKEETFPEKENDILDSSVFDPNNAIDKVKIKIKQKKNIDNHLKNYGI